MSYKLTCPGCDRYTSAIFRSYEDGYPCPYCGSSLRAASAQYYRQLPVDETVGPLDEYRGQ
jgi:rRNA maturation endonuclease Nob1